MTKGIYHQAVRLLQKEGNLDHHSRIIERLVDEIKRLRADNEFLHKFVDAPGSTLESALDMVRKLMDAIEKQQTAFKDAIETAGKTLTDKDIELARWRQIAIEERAKILSDPAAWDDRYETIRHPKTNIHSKDYFRERAAKELNLQLTQEAGYVERLEKDYAKLWRMCYGDPKQDDVTRIQAALTKIREGK